MKTIEVRIESRPGQLLAWLGDWPVVLLEGEPFTRRLVKLGHVAPDLSSWDTSFRLDSGEPVGDGSQFAYLPPTPEAENLAREYEKLRIARYDAQRRASNPRYSESAHWEHVAYEARQRVELMALNTRLKSLGAVMLQGLP